MWLEGPECPHSLRGREERQPRVPASCPAPDWARPWLSGSALSSPAAGTKSQAVTPLNGRGRGRGLCAVLLPGAVGKAGAAPFLPSRVGSVLSSHASSRPSFRPYTCPSIQPAVRRFTELPLCSGCCPGTLLPARPSQVLLWEINAKQSPSPPIHTRRAALETRLARSCVPGGDSKEPAVRDHRGSHPVAVSY